MQVIELLCAFVAFLFAFVASVAAAPFVFFVWGRILGWWDNCNESKGSLGTCPEEPDRR